VNHPTAPPPQYHLTPPDALPISHELGSSLKRVPRRPSDILPIGLNPPRKSSPCRLNGVKHGLQNTIPHELRGDLQRVPRGLNKRSEEHTSELQSRFDLVCGLLLA